ncbi:MAG: hypothetical protein H6869_09050 [Rhodospirillales bacterium]|nr:hypothetical protein [Rhodospirillales bacterium]
MTRDSGADAPKDKTFIEAFMRAAIARAKTLKGAKDDHRQVVGEFLAHTAGTILADFNRSTNTCSFSFDREHFAQRCRDYYNDEAVVEDVAQELVQIMLKIN